VARVGYAHGNSLLYGFGGIAWGDVDTSSILDTGETYLSGATDHVGWTAGVGVDYALSERFSVRVEYSYVDLGEEPWRQSPKVEVAAPLSTVIQLISASTP
jgi:outer membrane immunogenic protein